MDYKNLTEVNKLSEEISTVEKLLERINLRNIEISISASGWTSLDIKIELKEDPLYDIANTFLESVKEHFTLRLALLHQRLSVL